LNGPEGNAQAQGCLPGTKIFGVRHDQVFFGVSLLKLQIQQILSREQEKLQRKKCSSRNFVTHFAGLVCTSCLGAAFRLPGMPLASHSAGAGGTVGPAISPVLRLS
jgi:hypothetical protein